MRLVASTFETLGESTFYRVFRIEKAKLPSELMVRFEGVPGEFAQFDFGVADVRLLDGDSPVESEAIRLRAPPRSTLLRRSRSR